MPNLKSRDEINAAQLIMHCHGRAGDEIDRCDRLATIGGILGVTTYAIALSTLSKWVDDRLLYVGCVTAVLGLVAFFMAFRAHKRAGTWIARAEKTKEQLDD